ncbi:hypothetical protein MKL26_02880 [Streptococcus suis]|nr:hypothetical protein [Streptococcus suis]
MLQNLKSHEIIVFQDTADMPLSKESIARRMLVLRSRTDVVAELLGLPESHVEKLERKNWKIIQETEETFKQLEETCIRLYEEEVLDGNGLFDNRFNDKMGLGLLLGMSEIQYDLFRSHIK